MLELFFVFLKIGLFTIGGGYAMIPMITDEVVMRGWADQTALVDFIAISESTPGTFAINIATFVGNEVAGFWGGLVATIGLSIPSFVIILLIAKCFSRFMSNRYATNAFVAVKPVVVGLLAVTVFSIGSKIIFENVVINNLSTYKNIDFIAIGIIAILAIVSKLAKKLSPIFLILISAVLGIVFYGLQNLIVSGSFL